VRHDIPSGLQERADGQTEGSYEIDLSGGGVRAALFALGALLFIVESGVSARVRVVSSVSGGSLVNATLAMWKDFSKATAEDFEELCRDLARRISLRGVFFWSGWRAFLTQLALALVWGVAAMTVFSFVAGPGATWTWRNFLVIEGCYLAVAVLLAAYQITMGRQRTQIRANKVFLRATSSGTTADRPKPASRPTLADFSPSVVRHVLCATELTSGRPFFMDRDGVSSRTYGRGGPGISVAQAIYASAAFPIVFPPLRVSSEKLALSGSDRVDAPRKVWLSDGGVYNNLANEFDEAFLAEATNALRLRTGDPGPGRLQRILINASAPSRVRPLPRMWIRRGLEATARIMSITYENTVRPRIEALVADEGRPGSDLLIDIAVSPMEVARRLRDSLASDADAVRRAKDLIGSLSAMKTEREWIETSTAAAAVKTVLSPIGLGPAARLLHQGYVDAAIVCHIKLAAPLGSAKSIDWFQRLLRRRAAPVPTELDADHGEERQGRRLSAARDDLRK